MSDKSHVELLTMYVYVCFLSVYYVFLLMLITVKLSLPDPFSSLLQVFVSGRGAEKNGTGLDGYIRVHDSGRIYIETRTQLHIKDHLFLKCAVNRK